METIKIDALERIMNKRKIQATTLTDHIMDQNMKGKLTFKCEICRDTGWELNEETGAYRRCSCYKKDRIQNLWNKYGVDPKNIKKLNDFKPIDDVQQIAKDRAINYITNFEKIKKSNENGFALLGQPGAGKTHIINAIGAALIKKGYGVVYMPYVETMRELKSNVLDNEYYIKLSTTYQKATVLIIDDLFKDKFRNGKLVGELKETDIKHLYPILNYRYLKNLPTLISSEGVPQKISMLDDAQAGRLLEKCGDNITVFTGEKYNYRMRKFIS